MKASLSSDPEYRKAWLQKRREEVSGVFGVGYYETLEHAIRMSDDGLLLNWLPGTWTEIGWLPSDGLPEEGHALIGEVLSFYERARPWWWGDWLRLGEFKWGQTYTQAVKLSGRQYYTLAGYLNTVRRFVYDRRWLPPVWYSHHAKLAPRKYTEKDQDLWLKLVQVRGLSVEDLGLLLSKLPEPPPEPEPIFEWLDEWKAAKEAEKAVQKAIEQAEREGGVVIDMKPKEHNTEVGVTVGKDDVPSALRRYEVACPGCGLIFKIGEATGSHLHGTAGTG